MAVDIRTVARPYAKAIFAHALAESQLSEWSVVLKQLAAITLDAQAKALVTSPEISASKQAAFVLGILEQSQGFSSPVLQQLIALLAKRKRLLIAADVYAQYEALRAEQEKTLTANVTSFSALTDEQEQRLIASLSRRLQRKVILNVTVDKSLLGGAKIQVGDLGIDGSVMGKLKKLGNNLATSS